MGVIRLAGKAHAGEAAVGSLLDRVYGGNGWDAPSRLAKPHQALADALAASFPRWPCRNAYLLRASGSQDRAMVHLTNTPIAVEAFALKVKAALKPETIIAGQTLSIVEKDKAVLHLFERFRGLTLTTRQMYATENRYSLLQLRTISNRAAQRRYGRWDGATGTMEWFAEREPEPTLGL